MVMGAESYLDQSRHRDDHRIYCLPDTVTGLIQFICREKNQIISGLDVCLIEAPLEVRQWLNLINKCIDTLKIDSGENAL